MSSESVLLTPVNNRLHLRAQDTIRTVRIDRVSLKNVSTTAIDYALELILLDEAAFQLWRYQVIIRVDGETEEELIIERTFAVWDSLTVELNGVGGGTNPYSQNLRACMYYTINPD